MPVPAPTFGRWANEGGVMDPGGVIRKRDDSVA
jgi:hypothetical protein